MNRHRLVLLAAPCLLLMACRAEAVSFSLSQSGGTWNTIYAQGFSPSVDATPDPGLSAGDLVSLDSFTFYKSGVADAASDIRLAITEGLYYDYTTPLTTGSAALAGLSDNTIASTAGLATNDAIAFSFTGVDLTYGNDYGAVFVTESGGVLTPVLVSALTANYVETAPGSGVFVPETNYGGIDNFNYATSNFINNGFFNAFSRAGDAAFFAEFSVVPEPSCLLLLALVAPLAGAARGRRG